MTVRSLTGDFTLDGSVLGFDGDYLRLDTIYGELTLNYSGVDCAGAGCPDAEGIVPVIALSGAARLGDLILPALVEAFARDRDMMAERQEVAPGRFDYVLRDARGAAAQARFAFRVTTTEDGLADLLSNEADIVMAAREVGADEIALAEEAGFGRLDAPGQMRMLAFDALVPVVTPGRRIRALTLPDLARVFAGEVTDWAELGAEAGPIHLHLGDAEGGQVQGFVARVLAATGRDLSPTVIGHPTASAAAEAIVADPMALGLLPFGALGNAQAVAISGTCGLLATARPETVRTEDYPLTTPLFLYLPLRRMPPIGADFLDWLDTGEAQLVLRRAGVLGLDAVPIPVAEQGDRLAAAIAAAGADVPLSELQRMVAMFAGHVRLSPTFRFGGGATGLDAASRSQVAHLAQAIVDGRHDRRDLVLVGFSDGRGPATANRRLAAARAEAVQVAVLDALGGVLPDSVTLRTEAFGEALPIACDDTRWGRSVNRRVELWAGDPDWP